MAPLTATPPRVHPLHALLLAFPVALFATALLADVTYLNTAEMQWSNFAAWAIAGALLVGAPALVWAVLGALRTRAWLYPLLLGTAWLLGLWNAFHHAGDAWASVGASGLIVSLLSTGLTFAAGWFAFAPRTRETAR